MEYKYPLCYAPNKKNHCWNVLDMDNKIVMQGTREECVNYVKEHNKQYYEANKV